MSVDHVTNGFVLRSRSYGESDRIVTFITEHHGKLTGIAKAAKNSRRRFGGTLERFVHVRITFRQRPTAELAFLVQCDLIDALRAFSRDLDRFTAGSYLLDLTDRMTFGRESGHEVYRLLHDALALLDGGSATDPVLRAFELKLLATSGYGAPLDRCRRCGSVAPAAGVLYLVVQLGELVCRRCVPAGPVVRPIRASTTATLAALAAQPLAAAAQAPAAVVAEACLLLEQLLSAVSGGPPKSRALLSLGAMR